MTTVFQPARKDEYKVLESMALFIQLDDGNSIRLEIDKSGVTILPINGIKHELVVLNGSPGIRFSYRSPIQ